MRHRLLLLAALAPATLAACAGAPSAERDLARVREATAPFRDLDAAVAAGYARSVSACVSHPRHGGMGFHHPNRALFDARLELERPEYLVYGRAADGTYVLNGVEYVVPYSAHPREGAPPRIMGQPLLRSDELGIWYLHVWAWTENPRGLFASWHPGVTCP